MSVCDKATAHQQNLLIATVINQLHVTESKPFNSSISASVHVKVMDKAGEVRGAEHLHTPVSDLLANRSLKIAFHERTHLGSGRPERPCQAAQAGSW